MNILRMYCQWQYSSLSALRQFPKRLILPGLLYMLLPLMIAKTAGMASDWRQFRGPNGSGTVEATDLPLEFGPQKNLIWKTALPAGHSSPVISEDFIFLTAFEGQSLLTLCLNRDSGEIVWRRSAPRDRQEKFDNRNSPASPSVVTDGQNVFVFFPDFGVLAYDLKGNEKWRQPLGPFNNVYGMGASPILVDDKLVLVCDQSVGSFIIAFDKNTGKTIWRTARPQAKSGHSTPVAYRDKAGGQQIIVSGSFLLTSYSADSGEKLWWVRGLSFEMKSTPVMQDNMLFINGYGSPLNQPGSQVEVLSFEKTLETQDSDGNRLLTKEELPDEPANSWFSYVDLAADGSLDADDWAYLQAALSSLNGMLAIRLDGRGDMTKSNIVWQYHRSVPQLPSPLLYKNILYMVNDGGIVTSFSPNDGNVIHQGRLMEAMDKYYASPVAADNKVFFVSEQGKVSVLRPGGSLDVAAVNDLAERCYATPAIAPGRIYIRTVKALYCFGGNSER